MIDVQNWPGGIGAASIFRCISYESTTARKALVNTGHDLVCGYHTPRSYASRSQTAGLCIASSAGTESGVAPERGPALGLVEKAHRVQWDARTMRRLAVFYFNGVCCFELLFFSEVN